MEMKELKPSLVFEHFAKINSIPRPSKHEEKMIEYLKEFGAKRNLETKVDATGNVIIRKPCPSISLSFCAPKESQNDKLTILIQPDYCFFFNNPSKSGCSNSSKAFLMLSLASLMT